jgi:pimeloyl-ACP methyl ester carboxylesterase
MNPLSSSAEPTVTTPAWVDREAFHSAAASEVTPGRRVHYVDEGHGDVILFVHGTPTWSFEWRHCIREVSRTHRCIAMDNLGFGLSDRRLRLYTRVALPLPTARWSRSPSSITRGLKTSSRGSL